MTPDGRHWCSDMVQDRKTDGGMDMKNIVLFCAAGLSTTMLVSRMVAAAKELQYDCRIQAYPVAAVGSLKETPDIVLVGPQVRFHLPRIRENYPCIPVEVIDIASFGVMDGKKIMANVKRVLEEKE